MNDLRYALRLLFRKPAGVIIIVATLALLISGAGLALGFIQHETSSWNPFPDSHEIARLWRLDRERPEEEFPAAVYAELKKRITTLKHVAAIRYANPKTITGRGEPVRATTWEVSAAAFAVAGIQPLFGRTFTSEEERIGNYSPIILSHELWEEKFASRKDILGQVITLEDTPHTIIGVMPDGYEHNAMFYAADAWIPGNFESPAKPKRRVQIIGRLKPDATREQLAAEVAAIAPPIEKAFKQAHDYDAGIDSARPYDITKDFRRVEIPLVIIATAIPLFVLLIACFNIANILLARMLARRKEFAVRSSLGADRQRLVRQLLIESVVIAVGGALAGMLATVWINHLAQTSGLPLEFSRPVFAAMLALAVLIGLMAGWVPSLRATGGDLNSALKSGESGSRENRRFRSFLVIGQVGMATALCIAAALLVRSYINRKNFNPGFETARLLNASVSLHSNQAYKETAARLLWIRQAKARIESLAGVGEVGLCSTAPVDRWPISLSFRHRRESESRHRVRVSLVSPNYFGMINVPVLRGRPIEDSDQRGSESVALVNQRFAETHFPGQDPVGQRIHLGLDEKPDVTIIGIVPDRRNLGHRENLGEEIYLSANQYAPKWASMHLLVRTKAAPESFTDPVHKALRSIDPALPVNRPHTIDSRIERAATRDVEGIYAIAAISAFGLLMAVLGIYGVISHFVVARTREVGVRMALGATRFAISNLILRQGMKLVLTGLILGFVLAAGITIGLRELLYGVQSHDPTTYASVAAAIATTALLAAIFPARKAAQVQPMKALRHD